MPPCIKPMREYVLCLSTKACDCDACIDRDIQCNITNGTADSDCSVNVDGTSLSTVERSSRPSSVVVVVTGYSSMQQASPLRELTCHIRDHTVLPAK